MSVTPSGSRPVKLLIAAMGGEGGGVLTDWIIQAATACGFPTQSTSIPGVAQRTGATTYYIEILPRPLAPGEARPLMALNPVPGDVDIMIASEFLEAGRAISNGFVTPDRTLLIASTHRVFAIAEKSAMDDGRFDMGRLFRAAREFAQETVLFDMDEAARESGSILNAVLLGALAGCGRMPLPVERLEDSIRAGGKAVESNLAGFRFGLAHARGELEAAAKPASRRRAPKGGIEALRARVQHDFPEAAHEIVLEGVARLSDYQNATYAERYLDRLAAVWQAERDAGGDASLTREVGRHLALRMSFEDLVRVANAKIAPDRFERIRKEIGARDGQPVAIVDYFKPGIEEACSLLPPRLARHVLAMADRRGWRNKAYLGMKVRTTSMTGYLRVWMLAKLKPLRPYGYRFHEEQAQIDGWLDAVRRATAIDLGLAREIAECARLIKGYGDTHRRGLANYDRIATEIFSPALGGAMPAALAADAVLNVRTAALADPEGRSLDRSLEAIRARIGQKPSVAAE